MLSKLFGRKKPQVFDRNGERHDVTVGIMSRELPGYRAITIDISESGCQIQTPKILEIGLEPLLNFEFDREELQNFACRAKVVWSRQQDERAKFNSGLAFIPSDDDQKRNLSRMATIMQVRSQSDLRTLLDEANRVDPERAAVYAGADHGPSAATSHIKPLAPEAKPAAPPPPTAPTPVAPVPAQPASYAGLYIPLSVTVEGYTWNQRVKTLHLGLTEGSDSHNLFFPDCQLFRDEGCATGKTVAGLFSTFTSKAKDTLKLGPDTAEWKHYRFIATDGSPLIDIVSKEVQSSPTS